MVSFIGKELKLKLDLRAVLCLVSLASENCTKGLLKADTGREDPGLSEIWASDSVILGCRSEVLLGDW